MHTLIFFFKVTKQRGLMFKTLSNLIRLSREAYHSQLFIIFLPPSCKDQRIFEVFETSRGN